MIHYVGRSMILNLLLMTILVLTKDDMSAQAEGDPTSASTVCQNVTRCPCLSWAVPSTTASATVGVNITATSVYPHPDATYALNITSYNSSSVNMTSFNSSAENITTYNSSSTKWIMCNNHTNMTTANMTSGNMTSNNMTSKMCHNLTSSLVSLTPSPVAKETCALRATCVVSTTCTAYLAKQSPTPVMQSDAVTDSAAQSSTSVTQTDDPTESASPVASAIAPTPASEMLSPASSSQVVQCMYDCNGVCNGDARENECEVCVMGTTGKYANDSMDCQHTCNGTARYDSCGACTLPDPSDPLSTASPFQDCFGTCHGKAKNDTCGQCTGGKTGKAPDSAKDACGVCHGTNTTCTGCDGVPNSGKTRDACGVCDGDGSTCISIAGMEPNSVAEDTTKVTIRGAGLNGNVVECVLFNETGVEVARLTATVIDRTKITCDLGNKLVDKSMGKYAMKVAVDSIVTNETIDFYHFKTTRVNCTAIDPSQAQTDALPATINVRGTGFFNWTGALCYLNDAKVSAQFVNENTMKCAMPSDKPSGRYEIKLSMDEGHHNACVQVLEIYAPAPAIAKAQLSYGGSMISVTFDSEVESKAANGDAVTTCQGKLDSSTVSNLGDQPSCTWASGIEMTITLGSGAIIIPGNSITVKNNIIKRLGEALSRAAQGSVTVEAPANPEKPVPVISGPALLGSCGNLSLSAAQSTGSGGRAMNYSWALVLPVSGSGVLDIKALLSSLTMSTDRVKVPGNLLQSGTAYTFQLGVSNFLRPGVYETTRHVVEKGSVPSPEVTIAAPLDASGEMFASEPLTMTGKAKVAPCATNSKVQFSWGVSCSDSAAKQKLETSSGFMATREQTSLVIDAGALTGDVEYTFTVTGKMSYDTSIQASASITVKVKPTPLEAGIAGGDRVIGRECAGLKLDAAQETYDPENEARQLSCTWSCQDSSGKPCYSAVNLGQVISFPPDCVTTIPCNEFTIGKTYTISANVKKGSRKASASIKVEAVAGNPPEVSVEKASIKMVSDDKLILKGNYKTVTKPDSVKWDCQKESGYAYIDLQSGVLSGEQVNSFTAGGLSFASITIAADILTPGAKYRFVLKVSHGGTVGVSSMEVQVRSGPTSGQLTTESDTVEALQPLTLRAPLWTASSDALPLKYEYGFEDKTGEFRSWGTFIENELAIMAMPPGFGAANKLTLFLYVYDKFGSKASTSKEITSTPPSQVDSGVVNKVLDDAMSAMDSGSILNALTAFGNLDATLASSDSASDELKLNVSRAAQDMIEDFVSNTVVSSANCVPLINTMSGINASAAKNFTSLAKITGKLVDGCGEKKLGNSTIHKAMDWMAEVFEEGPQDDADFCESVYNTFNSFSDNQLKDISLGEKSQTIASELGDVTLGYFDFKHEMNAEGNDTPSIDFGDTISEQFKSWSCGQGKTCVGAKVKTIAFKKDVIQRMALNDMNIFKDQTVAITLYHPLTNVEMSVSDLNKKLVIKFKSSSAASCYYYNKETKLWDNSGLTAEEGPNGELLCHSSHLTVFGASNNTIESSTTTSVPPSTAGAGDSQEETYDVKLCLTNKTWSSNLSDSTSVEYKDLAEKMQTQMDSVYKDHSTYVKTSLKKFEENSGDVCVFMDLVFGPTDGNDPSSVLKAAIENGKLGDIQIDPDSLTFVSNQPERIIDEDDPTGAIVGGVVGGTLLFLLLVGVVLWYKSNLNKKPRGGRVSPMIHNTSNNMA